MKSKNLEAQRDKKKVHFATVISKNAELGPTFQKYKGRVVLRADSVKDHSGAYAVFTEQGSSASQMTAAKVMDVIARLPDCDEQAADAVSACTQVKLEDVPSLLKIPDSECPDVWIRLPRHRWPKPLSNIEDPVVLLERNLYGHPPPGLLRERQFEEILLGLGWEKATNWECLFVHRKQGLFLSVFVDDIKMSGKKQNLGPMWKNLMKFVRKMFESRVSAGVTEKLPVWEKPNAKTVAWSYDMEGHARKCVERYCELANKKVEQLCKVSSLCLNDHNFKEEEL